MTISRMIQEVEWLMEHSSEAIIANNGKWKWYSEGEYDAYRNVLEMLEEVLKNGAC